MSPSYDSPTEHEAKSQYFKPTLNCIRDTDFLALSKVPIPWAKI